MQINNIQQGHLTNKRSSHQAKHKVTYYQSVTLYC